MAQFTCDRCGRQVDRKIAIQYDAGAGSALGSGNRVEIDLCEPCLVGTLGAWLRVGPSPVEAPDASGLDRSSLGVTDAALQLGVSSALQQRITHPSEEQADVAWLVDLVARIVVESGNPQGFDAWAWVHEWISTPCLALGGLLPRQYLDNDAGRELLTSLVLQMQSNAYL